MKMVGSIPTTPTGFEMMILEHFGTRVDLSSSMGMAVVGIAILMVPFFLAGSSNAAAR